MSNKAQIIIRMDRDDLNILDCYVKHSGLSREEYIRTLCSIVTRLDCRPSEVEKLKRAYWRGE